MRTLTLISMLLVTPAVVAPTVPTNIVVEIENKPKVKILTDYQKFTDAMGNRESSNNYTVVNKFGYMGKYQFGKSTLRTLKIKVTKEAFLNSPSGCGLLELCCGFGKTICAHKLPG